MRAQPSLSPTAKIIQFFALSYHVRPNEPPGIPRTRLVKVIYMADLLSRQYLGHQLSDLHYQKFDHGPYDPEIKTAVRELINRRLVSETRPARGDAWYSGTDERVRVVANPAKSIPPFTPGELAILEYVIHTYLTMPLEELLNDVVYETPPMVAITRAKEPLDMGSVDNVGRNQFGFDLEEVMASFAQARRGEFADLDSLVDELHAKANQDLR